MQTSRHWDLTTVIEYTTSGMIEVAIPDTTSTEEALDVLSASLASLLGVSEDEIELDFDAESGEIAYAVSTTDYRNMREILDTLQNIEDFEIDSNLIEVSNITPTDKIVAEVSALVNADETSSTLQQSKNILDAMLSDSYALAFESNTSYRRKIHYIECSITIV